MANSKILINVTACDNELFLIAGQHDRSYLLANIKSGNHESIEYTLKIEKGQFGGTKNVGNPFHPIREKNTTYLPHGQYSLIVLGADWGGSEVHFDLTLEGGDSPFHVKEGPKSTKSASGWAANNVGVFTVPKT